MHIGIELGGTGCKIAIYKETEAEGLEQVFLEKLPTSQSQADDTVVALVEAGKRGL